MTTNMKFQLAAVLALGLGSSAVGYALPNDRSTSANDCGEAWRDCSWEVCNQGASSYECCDYVPYVCEIVDEHGTEVCMCLDDPIKENCSTYSCDS